MSQYGAAQNVPYTGQHDSELVDNPRYQGQSAGTVPHGSTGPQQESRYGAVPLSNTGVQHGQQYGGDQGAYGQSQTTGEYGSNPNAQSRYGSQTTGGYGSVDPNTRPDQAGYGSHQTGGYGTHHQPQSEYAREQPGYGQPGFGAPSEGQHTGSLWPNPTTPPNAHKHDLTSQGQGPYGQQQSGQGAYGQGGYDQPPRKEGIMDKVKDAVGMGPQSQGVTPGQGYNPNVNHPGEGTGFGGGQGHHPHHGGHDQLGGGYGTGVATGAAAYSQSQPRNEGVVDKLKDAVGMGPQSQGTTPGQGYNPNVNHPSEETGFGGGHGHHPHGGHDQFGAGGYNTGTTTGADAYSQSQPRKEGIVDRAKDAVGMGPNSGSGYDARTQTGSDAYVHGNHPHGMQDRVQGVNEPSLLGGEHGVHAPLGGREGVLREGEHVPHGMLGEVRTEPGYDMSKGHLGGHHQTHGDTGLGGHHSSGTGTGIGGHHQTLGDTGLGGHHNTDTGTGYGTGTGTGHRTGTDAYDETTTGTGTGTGTGSGYDDTAPKKGLMTKIKEKMHH